MHKRTTVLDRSPTHTLVDHREPPSPRSWCARQQARIVILAALLLLALLIHTFYYPLQTAETRARFVVDDRLFVRAAVAYLPIDTNYLCQAKWLLRSWQHMQLIEPPYYHTDVILVVDKWHPLLSKLPCGGNNEMRTVRDERGRCRILVGYAPTKKRVSETLANYRFADSIAAVPFANTSGALIHYDMILRTDLDTFLTPRFSVWRPQHFTVGLGKFCPSTTLDTCQRLRRIANDMGLAPPNGTVVVENVGSTWYGATERVVECAALTMRVMKYMHENEFTDEEKSRAYGIKGWPKWHHGVLSLYAGQIAINYCVGGEFERRPDMLDFPTSSDEKTTDHAHLHTWQNRGRFSKFVFFEGHYKNVTLGELNLDVVKDYAMYMALDSGNLTTE